MIGRAITFPIIALAVVLFSVGLFATASADIAKVPLFIFFALFVTSLLRPRSFGPALRG